MSDYVDSQERAKFLAEFNDPKNKRIAALENDLRNLILWADNGEWHCSEDCEVEGRTDCALCDCIKHAQETLKAGQQ